MPKKISWKKGMRLTDEVLRAADACTAEYVSQAMALAAGGRFGLFPSSRPFQVQMSIAKGFVDVEALACLAITRGGYVIDTQFDTKFTNTLDGRVQIPNTDEEKEYLLTINARPGDWKDNGDGYMEPDYTFALINSQTALPDYAMPIARIVYDDGWREDNADFVPPCLYLSSHPKFEELHQQFVELLHGIDEHTRQQLDTAATTAISIYWPVVKQMLIAANTEHDTMAPQQLLAAVQKVVATFAVACDLDDLLTLEDGTAFHNYAAAPYSYSQAYQRIKQGLGLCYAIGEKIEKFSLLKREKPQPEPVRMPEPPKPTPAPDPRRIWDGKRI